MMELTYHKCGICQEKDSLAYFHPAKELIKNTHVY